MLEMLQSGRKTRTRTQNFVRSWSIQHSIPKLWGFTWSVIRAPALGYQFSGVAADARVMDCFICLGKTFRNPQKDHYRFHKQPLLCYFGKFFKCQKWEEYFPSFIPMNAHLFPTPLFSMRWNLMLELVRTEICYFLISCSSMYLAGCPSVNTLQSEVWSFWKEWHWSVLLHRMRNQATGVCWNRGSCCSVTLFMKDRRYL